MSHLQPETLQGPVGGFMSSEDEDLEWNPAPNVDIDIDLKRLPPAAGDVPDEDCGLARRPGNACPELPSRTTSSKGGTWVVDEGILGIRTVGAAG